MSRLPDFGQMEWALPKAGQAPSREQDNWQTPEGIPVAPVYDEAALNGLDFLETMPGFRRRGLATSVGAQLVLDCQKKTHRA